MKKYISTLLGICVLAASATSSANVSYDVIEDVSWVRLVNAEVSGTTLTSTDIGGSGGLSAIVGDGGIEYYPNGDSNYHWIGLSQQDISTSETELEYSFYLMKFSDGSVYLAIEENGNRVTNLGYMGTNEQLRIYRVGETVYYQRNGNIVHTSTKTSNSPLIVDTAFKNGVTLTDVKRFGSTFLADTDADGRYGSDDLFPNDGTEWADIDSDGIGDNSDLDNDNDGMPDTYEVAMGYDPLSASDATLDTDGDGHTNLQEYLLGYDPHLAYEAIENIEWINLINAEVTGTTLISTDIGGSSGLNAIVGDGGIEYYPNSDSNYHWIGLSQQNVSTASSELEYSFYLMKFTSGSVSLAIEENGNRIKHLGSMGENEQLRIYRVGETVYYQRNGNIVHTSTKTANYPLVVDTTLKSGVMLTDVKRFGSTFLADTDTDGRYGSDDLFPNDGTEWADVDSDGIGDNSDLDNDNDGMPNTYEVAMGYDPLNALDATLDADGDGHTNLQEYLLGYDPNLAYETIEGVEWINLVNAEVTGTTLTSTGIGGASGEVTIAGDGGIEYSPNFDSNYHWIGLSQQDVTTAKSELEYSFYLMKFTSGSVSLAIEENGNRVKHLGHMGANEQLRIYRVGETVYYQRNGNIVHTSTKTANYPLVVDTTLKNSVTLSHVKWFGDLLAPTEWLVTKTADTNDGNCDVTDCSLREAVIAANTTAGTDTITLPAGEYQLTLVGTDEEAAATGDLDITEDLIINGEDMATTTINGMGSSRLFDVNQGTGEAVSLTLTDVTLRNGANWQAVGDPGRYGAGVAFYSEGTLTLENTTFTKNQATGNGGASVEVRGVNPQLIVGNSVFAENCAATAPAISGEGNWIISNTTFANNGGLFTPDQGVADTCQVAHGGGALYMQDTTATISNSAFISNTSTGGGAIYVYQGNLTLRNSTLANNTATDPEPDFGGWGYFTYGGGAIEVYDATVTIENSTLVNNQSLTGVGGGINVVDDGYNAPSVSVVNSIVANNTAPLGIDCYGTVTSQGHNLVGDWSGCTYTSASGDLLGDPGLGALVDEGVAGKVYYPLSSGSQAIDAADDTQCEVTDQRGATRPIDGNQDGLAACDMGAHEFDPAENPVTTTTGYDYGWLRTIFSQEVVSNSGDFGADVVTDSEGNAYFVGYFHGTADFDSASDVNDDTRVNAAEHDYGWDYGWASDSYLVRINSDGSFGWVRTLAGAADPDRIQAYNVLMGDDGSLYVVGTFTGEINFDVEGAGDSRETGSNVFVTKFTNPTASNTQYAGTYVFDNFPIDQESGMNKYGNIDAVIHGSHITIVGFSGNDIEQYEVDQGAQSDYQLEENEWTGYYQRSQAVVKKITTDLSTLTAEYGFTSDIRGAMANTITVDASGNIYIAGRYDHTISFGGTGGSEASSGMAGYVVKLNATGGYEWSRSFNGEAEESTIDANGNLILTGAFEGSVSFGSTSHTSLGGKDIFVAKLDTNGNYTESHSLGGTGKDRGLAVAATGDYIFISGEKAGKAASYAYKSGNLDIVEETNASGQVNAVTAASDGSVYITGQFDGLGVDFTPNNEQTDTVDAHILDVFMQELIYTP